MGSGAFRTVNEVEVNGALMACKMIKEQTFKNNLEQAK